MDLKQAFNYMFNDKDLKKNFIVFLILSFLSNIGNIILNAGNIRNFASFGQFSNLGNTQIFMINPTLSLVLGIISFIFTIISAGIFCGFFLRIVRNTTLPVNALLPDIHKEAGGLFADGFRCGLGVILWFVSLGLLIMIPFAILTGIIMGALLLAQVSPITATVVNVLLSILLLACIFGYLTAGMINFVHKNTLWAFFQIPSIFRIIFCNFKKYISLIFLVSVFGYGITIIFWLAMMFPVAIWTYAENTYSTPLLAVAGIVGVIYFVLLTAFSYYIFLVNANLTGQYYKTYLEAQQR